MIYTWTWTRPDDDDEGGGEFDVEFDLTYHVTPGCKQTWTDPGCPAEVELRKVTLERADPEVTDSPADLVAAFEADYEMNDKLRQRVYELCLADHEDYLDCMRAERADAQREARREARADGRD